MSSYQGSVDQDFDGEGPAKVWRRGEAFPVTLLRAQYLNHSFPPHFHGTHVFAVNERGAHSLRRGGARNVVSISEIGIVNPGETHAVERAGPAAWIHRAIYPDAECLDEIVGEITGRAASIPLFPQPVVHDRPLARRLVRFHRALEASNDRLEQDVLIGETLALLVKRHARVLEGPPPAPQGSSLIKRVRDYLEAHHAEPVSLDDLARIARMSRFHLLRQFNRQVGLPPHAYLLQIRIGRARTLLSRGFPAGHAAHEVGFADQSHMHRYFKRFVGVTPGCYAAGMRASRMAISFKTPS